MCRMKLKIDPGRGGEEGILGEIGNVLFKGVIKILNQCVSSFPPLPLVYIPSVLKKKALNTHHNVTHLGKRDHICPYEHCDSTFAYKHLLQRHLGKVHTTKEGEATEEDEEGDAELKKEKLVQMMDIDTITGKTYKSLASSRLNDPTSNVLRCPHPLIPGSTTTTSSSSRYKGCEYVFSRAYDLRRHLRAEHGVTVDKEVADEWVRAKRRLY